jgi:hypothetical protein
MTSMRLTRWLILHSRYVPCQVPVTICWRARVVCLGRTSPIASYRSFIENQTNIYK